MTVQLDRSLASAREIYAALPEDWRLFVAHEISEPAFYSTVVRDWGTSCAIASELGPRASCLVDLGRHAPSVNVGMIVARLARFGEPGGFHDDDSKYGDDDLDAGTVDPYRLFLVMHEVRSAARGGARLAHMLDQSHNVTDPIESPIVSASAVRAAHAQALLVDRAALADAQTANDAIAAGAILRAACRTDVEPILAAIRRDAGGAIDPVAV